MQIADEVPECSGTHSKQSSGGFRCRGSGGFWCRWPMRFRRAAAQIAGKVPAMAGEVPEGSGTHSKQSSGGFRYKNLPRSSKLLGITHGFI